MNTDDVRQKINAIAAEGENVTQRVREVVESAARSLGDAGAEGQQRLTSLVSAAIDGASSAVQGSAPDHAESTLRQVIDGLGDGLQRTANATKLAVEESASSGKAFATEDLKNVAEDFKAIGQLIVETVEKHSKTALGQATGQMSNLKSHAERTVEGLRPALDDAAAAVTGDAMGLAGETAQAAANIAREATGSLFGALGRVLGDAGDKISPPKNK
ncbi:MAG: DUF6781 family protein [Planctomycetota bacterium]